MLSYSGGGQGGRLGEAPPCAFPLFGSFSPFGDRKERNEHFPCFQARTNVQRLRSILVDYSHDDVVQLLDLAASHDGLEVAEANAGVVGQEDVGAVRKDGDGLAV